ncbi:MAG: sodium/proton-translocating pyrophosphatase [Fimbriimonadaceae bacterium]|nr:sodium/proton-translocating pyrophosphatase [Fimbriimonadaceae bacterium]QYK55351.1 MAG: sodium/proton-translocating pyrophosphatase [Fimbriimonadaceae bacterium]
MPTLARLPRRLLGGAMLLAPVAALASEANVRLSFRPQDQIYLIVSLVIGIISIIAALAFRSHVIAQSPGNEKMQEVGKAIHEGALAYLGQQFRLMVVFIVVLAIGLYALYQGDYGATVATFVAVCFVLGVLASYVAGFVGMDMAVRANMRAAAAALTSNKRSLEVAFRAGAVAGLMTVGMGLIGATLILWLGQSDAMKYLIGFGFGGSLAALFMRVGGGIYTKAADVGADLVGKVEAGIPEDDPRNPAVIADNVGDNVGDCAGMAADVFESYEVTLVSAIVLGAATAVLFDTETWMRLVLFALMARGVGIIASIVGVLMVKGSDNVDTDPLKPITFGFQGSALLAAVLTFGLAYMMLGGVPSVGGPVVTNLVTTRAQKEFDEISRIKDIQKELAVSKNVPLYEVTAADIENDKRAQELFPVKAELQQAVSRALFTPEDQIKAPEPTEGFSPVDWSDTKRPLLTYATTEQQRPDNPAQAPPEPTTMSLADRLSKGDMRYYKLSVEFDVPAAPGSDAKPEKQTQTFYYGPTRKDDFDKLVKQAQDQGQKIKVEGDFPIKYMTTRTGKLVVGIVDNKSEVPIHKVAGPPITYYEAPVAKIKELQEKQKASPQTQVPMPQMQTAEVVGVREVPVPYFKFFGCVFFGIIMAFLFERLTDYYVSLHKKPVREVAAVATAGPAPMIIQGIALGKESAVMSLFAIVACLIAPLLIFPASEYGSYILSFYGIALVGLGLLTTTGYILAMDTFGPISDNAQGVFEMSGAGADNPTASKGIQRLDAAGNTTKALTKGFAIATAVVAAVALFHAFVESAMLNGIGMRLDVPEIFLGLLIGGAAPYLFAAFSINAVGRAAFQLINEVRRQFRSDPGIMAGTSKPDYARCVAIVTSAAQKELLGPGILAIALPVMVAFGFSIGKAPTEIGGQLYNLTGAQALGGFLAGTILSGQLLAVMLANSGGIWDNAKKLIEDGLHGGKGTEAHKAGVVCDTVGDPFKDTAGPALNPLIKVMNLIALLLVPAIIAPLKQEVLIVITVVSAIFLVIAFAMSKRSSLGSEMAAIESSTPPSA